MKQLLSLIALFTFYLYGTAQISKTVTFPVNRFVNCNPYPYVPAINVDTTKLERVEKYGAKGDGSTLDDAAIASAIKNARYGVIFTSGKTYLVSKKSTVMPSRGKDIIVYAYGATIKMANMTKYSFFSIEYPKDQYNDTVIWLGGTLDGNKDKQMWPGSPTGNNNWAEAHGRFVGVENAEFVIFKDVTLINIVMDGIGLDKCRLGVIADSKASGGAPFKWSEVGQQGTYFKWTRAGFKTGYGINLDCDGGSIGVQFSYPEKREPDTGTLGVLVNVKIRNAAQNPIHNEDTDKFFGKDIYVSYDNGMDGKSFHLSNRSQIVSLKNVVVKNTHIDFNNASSLKIGVIDSCQFSSNGSLRFSWYAQRPMFVLHSKFDGEMKNFQSQSNYNLQDTFLNFGSYPAILDYKVVESCVFENGSAIPIQNGKGGGAIIHDCTFINCTRANKNDIPSNDSYKNMFKSFIDVRDNNGNWLMRIDCGIK